MSVCPCLSGTYCGKSAFAMIVFINLGSEAGNWYLGPLMMFVVPYLLNGGFHQLLAGLVYVVSSMTGGELNNWLTAALASTVVAGLLAGLVVLRRWVPTRLRQMLQQLLFTGMAGGSYAAAGAAERQRPQRQMAEQRQQRWDQVVKVLQKLPTDVVVTRKELEQRTISELKEQLAKQGVSSAGCVEKRELIDKLLAAGGSSSTSCSICCEDYAAGDVVRLLPCKHRYHIECVDRWFLSSTDYSRAPACPMCNGRLLPE